MRFLALEPQAAPAVLALIQRAFRTSRILRADRRSCEPEFTSRWRLILFADPCSYCGGTVDTVDHIAARAAGGHEGWSNMTGACKRCNSRKGKLALWEFLLARSWQYRLVTVPQTRPLPKVLHAGARFDLFSQRLRGALGVAAS